MVTESDRKINHPEKDKYIRTTVKNKLSSTDAEGFIKKVSEEEIERLPYMFQETPVSTGWIPEESENSKRRRKNPNLLGNSHRYGTTKFFRLDEN